VIPGAVDLSRFRPIDRRAARRTLDWDEAAPVALFPGRRTNVVKRYDLFNAAVAVARRRVPELRTATLDGLDRAHVAAAMAAADVTVLTSDTEGSPITVKESLASQTPVVSVPVGDVPDVVADLPGCAIRPRDPEQLGAAVVEALAAPGTSALRERAAHYGREETARRLLQVYAGAIGSRT
jgi:glycosyltransferase involved in cell wall biosynthesis